MQTSAELKHRERELSKELHRAAGLLQGSIVALYHRCGNEACHCKSGQKHGPKYYLSTKEGGKTQMLYIPRDRLEEVRRAVERYRRVKETLSEMVSINRELFRQGEEVK